MRNTALFTMGILTGVILVNPAFQRMAKNSVAQLIHYTKEMINEKHFVREDTHGADEEPVSESMPEQ